MSTNDIQEYVDYLFPGPIQLLKDSDDENDSSTSKSKLNMVYFTNPFDITNTAFMSSHFNVGINLSMHAYLYVYIYRSHVYIYIYIYVCIYIYMYLYV
jgi:hypothetical protein